MDWIVKEKADKVLKLVERQRIPNPQFEFLRGVISLSGVLAALITLCMKNIHVLTGNILSTIFLTVSVAVFFIKVRMDQLFTVEFRFYFDRIIIIRTEARDVLNNWHKEIISYVYIDDPSITINKKTRKITFNGPSYKTQQAINKEKKKVRRSEISMITFKPLTIELRTPEKIDVEKELRENLPEYLLKNIILKEKKR